MKGGGGARDPRGTQRTRRAAGAVIPGKNGAAAVCAAEAGAGAAAGKGEPPACWASRHKGLA